MFTIEKKQTYRKELSSTLSLSAGTVSTLCNKLVSLGIASECKQSIRPFGAKVKMFSMNRQSYCLAMLDIHQRKTAHFHVLHLDGTVLSTCSFPIADTVKKFLSDFSRIYSAEKQKILQKEIIGMSVSVSATVHKKSGKLVTAGVPIFEEMPLQNAVKKICQIPVVMENESVICSIASIIKNRATPQPSVYVFVEEGVGVGVVIQNKVIDGDNGLGSDISNILSPYTKTKKTVEQVLSSESRESKSVKAKTLGYLLSVLINLFDINTFYIGGYLSQQLSALSLEFNAVLDQFVLHRDLRDIRIIADTTYAETMKYGALAIIMPEVIHSLKKINDEKQLS